MLASLWDRNGSPMITAGWRRSSVSPIAIGLTMERAATPDEDKMLRGTVGRILYSPPCQKINFTVWKWPINGNGYRRVAEKLALTGPEKRIRFHLNPDKPNF